MTTVVRYLAFILRVILAQIYPVLAGEFDWSHRSHLSHRSHGTNRTYETNGTD
jgi:hypothetical protein